MIEPVKIPGLQPVLGGIRAVVRVLERVDRVDDADRPEDLVADDPRRLGSLAEHERAERVRVCGTYEELRACGLGLLDPLRDPRARALVDHGADVGRLLGRIAHDQCLHLREEALEEAVDDGPLDIDPLDGDAALPGEGEGVRGELRGGKVEIGVGGHDDRRRVAELQPNALLGRALGDAPPDAARAGERDHPDAFVLDQDVADLAGRADEHVEPSRREACFLLELGE